MRLGRTPYEENLAQHHNEQRQNPFNACCPFEIIPTNEHSPSPPAFTRPHSVSPSLDFTTAPASHSPSFTVQTGRACPQTLITKAGGVWNLDLPPLRALARARALLSPNFAHSFAHGEGSSSQMQNRHRFLPQIVLCTVLFFKHIFRTELSSGSHSEGRGGCTK